MVAIILVGAFFLLSRKPASITNNIPVENANLIIFTQKGCSHCQNVEKYIQENNITSKIKIDFRELSSNSDNQKLLFETVKKCPEIDATQGVGTPLGYSTKENKCFYGDTSIIDWLKQMLQ